MAKHKRSGFFNTVLKIVSLAPILLKTATSTVALVKEETRQAKRHLAILLVLILLFATLFTTTWLCLLAILFYTLLSFKVSLSLALCLIFILNLLLLAIVGLGILNIRKNLFFPESRRLLLNFKK